jgi:hypothetical protein
LRYDCGRWNEKHGKKGVGKVLTEIGREILAFLDDDGVTPLEEIVLAFREKGQALVPEEFLGEVLRLFEDSLVTIMQEPIPSFGQTFPARVIVPGSPRDILGDVAQGFDEFCAAGDYARREKACARQAAAGVPFGIYLSLTDGGRRIMGEGGKC